MLAAICNMSVKMYDEGHFDAESEQYEMTEMMITITLIPLGTFATLILFAHYHYILLETQIEGETVAKSIISQRKAFGKMPMLPMQKLT